MSPAKFAAARRYNAETLAVRYKGHSISDVLEMPIEEALPLLENIPQIQQKLVTLVEVGLGYVQLGQSSTTLSGGEAQRIKLARELSKRQTGRTLYILDEPTTGLHFDDVRKLLAVLNRLAELGNTVLVIEHHMDVIKQADWIIDLGPEGGAARQAESSRKARPSASRKIKNLIPARCWQDCWGTTRGKLRIDITRATSSHWASSH